jgi:multiple sugar transport system ATP-binding protein
MVFQFYALYPHMTVRENLGFGLRMRRVDRSERRRRIDRAAQVLGLEGLLDRRPAQLSGGQRQRVALGRALVREPRVFLFDEPLSNLDARLRVELRLELAQLHARLGTTMIFVTHDQVEAMTLGQRIAVLWAGSLQQYAPPLEIYRDPANRIVAEFVGTPAINTVTGELRPSGAGAEFHHERLRLTLPGVGASGPATLGIRPEALALASDANGADLTSEVVRVETLGSELHVHVRGPDDRPWIVRAPATATPAPGRAVGLRLDRSAILLFDRSGGRIR